MTIDTTFDAEQWERDSRAALERAIGRYNMQALAWDEKAERNAAQLHLAEDDAVHALRELAHEAEELAAEITNPSEPQDERKPFRHVSLAHEFEQATIAMAQLASLRNHVRPSR